MGQVHPNLDTEDPLVGGRLVPDRLGTLGHTLTVDPPDAGQSEIRARALFEEGELVPLVEQHATRLDGAPAPVAASLWANYLVTVVCPPILAAWTLHDVGVDASAGNLALHLDEELPERVRVLDPTQTTRGRPARDRGPRTLLDTLTGLFETLSELTGVDPAILFNHVGNLTAYLFDRFLEAGIADESQEADRAVLLEETTLPWGLHPNPLEDPVDYETLDVDGLPERYQVRRRCCLKTAVPGKSPCASCPTIDRERRAERVRERRANG